METEDVFSFSLTNTDSKNHLKKKNPIDFPQRGGLEQVKLREYLVRSDRINPSGQKLWIFNCVEQVLFFFFKKQFNLINCGTLYPLAGCKQ